MNTVFSKGIPLNLATALAQSEAALRRFDRLSPREQQQLIRQARRTTGDHELRQLVRGLEAL